MKKNFCCCCFTFLHIGTGKSETGAHIAYAFAMANRKLFPRKCVLYCGPSNKSVDFVLGKFSCSLQKFCILYTVVNSCTFTTLEKLNKLCASSLELNLKILRIYNQSFEENLFSGANSRDSFESYYDFPDWTKAYTLHYKIREGPFASTLTEIEKKLEFVRQNGGIPDGKICREYRKTLAKAEETVLSEQYDIVLCTCIEASSSRITRHIFPRQCIVDDCEMAFEPECIAPLLLCNHIVLLGDHKQLQPVVDYGPARENGLATSLFQRYADIQDGCHIKTLTIQFRMVRC